MDGSYVSLAAVQIRTECSDWMTRSFELKGYERARPCPISTYYSSSHLERTEIQEHVRIYCQGRHPKRGSPGLEKVQRYENIQRASSAQKRS